MLNLEMLLKIELNNEVIAEIFCFSDRWGKNV